MLRSTATIPACGATTYHHHDGLGSVIFLTNASGSVVERYRYDVFGHVTILDAAYAPRAATAHNNRFLFTGREWLAQLELYDYRNRTYCPTLGRFQQTDPIRFDAGDGNLYRYAGNKVVNLTDPTGLIEPSMNSFLGALIMEPIKATLDALTPPTCSPPCCSKNLCYACCAAFVGVSQTACSRIVYPFWQAACRSIAAYISIQCIQGCNTCTQP